MNNTQIQPTFPKTVTKQGTTYVSVYDIIASVGLRTRVNAPDWWRRIGLFEFGFKEGRDFVMMQFIKGKRKEPFLNGIQMIVLLNIVRMESKASEYTTVQRLKNWTTFKNSNEAQELLKILNVSNCINLQQTLKIEQIGDSWDNTVFNPNRQGCKGYSRFTSRVSLRDHITELNLKTSTIEQFGTEFAVESDTDESDDELSDTDESDEVLESDDEEDLTNSNERVRSDNESKQRTSVEHSESMMKNTYTQYLAVCRNDSERVNSLYQTFHSSGSMYGYLKNDLPNSNKRVRSDDESVDDSQQKRRRVEIDADVMKTASRLYSEAWKHRTAKMFLLDYRFRNSENKNGQQSQEHLDDKFRKAMINHFANRLVNLERRMERLDCDRDHESYDKMVDSDI